MSPALRRQRGVALITAVLVVSLAVIASTSVLDMGHFAIQRASTLQDSEKAWGYAAGAEDWVRTILQRDDNGHDSLDEVWAEPQTLPIENGALQGAIVDALGRFNLNNLGLSNNDTPSPGRARGAATMTDFDKQAALFERLIDGLEGGRTLIPAPRTLAEAIRDWIDADQLPTGGGREDSDYLVLTPPRRVANRPMVSVTELRNVLESLYDPRTDDARKVYALLLPQVTALPVSGVTPINVNTATRELLLALGGADGGNAELAKFVELREEQPLESASEINSKLGLRAGDFDTTGLAVSSRLFQLRMQAVVGDGRVALYSLIYRPQQGMPVVLLRSTDTE